MKQEAPFKFEMDSITKGCTKKKPFPLGFRPTVPVNLASLILGSQENKAAAESRSIYFFDVNLCFADFIQSRQSREIQRARERGASNWKCFRKVRERESRAPTSSPYGGLITVRRACRACTGSAGFHRKASLGSDNVTAICYGTVEVFS